MGLVDISALLKRGELKSITFTYFDFIDWLFKNERGLTLSVIAAPNSLPILSLKGLSDID